MLRKLVPATLLLLLSSAAVAWGDHIPGQPCDDCASHAHWPRINGKVEKANGQSSVFHGTRRSDELLGHHGSDRLAGRGALGRPVGRLGGRQPAGHADRPHLRRPRQRLHLRLPRPQPRLRGAGERRDLGPLRPRDRRLRAGTRHLPRREVAQARLQVPQLRARGLPQRGAARRRAEAAALSGAPAAGGRKARARHGQDWGSPADDSEVCPPGSSALSASCGRPWAGRGSPRWCSACC